MYATVHAYTVKITFYNVQSDQINMDVFFWYLVKSDLFSVCYCTPGNWRSNFLLGIRNTWPCITGHTVQEKQFSVSATAVIWSLDSLNILMGNTLWFSKICFITARIPEIQKDANFFYVFMVQISKQQQQKQTLNKHTQHILNIIQNHLAFNRTFSQISRFIAL